MVIFSKFTVSLKDARLRNKGMFNEYTAFTFSFDNAFLNGHINIHIFVPISSIFYHIIT